jgi:hypothetical protein
MAPIVPLVPLARLVEALEMASPDNRAFLDSETGVIHVVSADDLPRLENDESLEDLPAWQRDLLAEVRAAYGRLLPLPDSFEIHEWRIMERFARQAPPGAQDALSSALHRRGAFRAFQDTADRLSLRDAWHEFLWNALADLAREWAAEHGIHVAPGPLPLDP